jgi:hypothetical protein
MVPAPGEVWIKCNCRFWFWTTSYWRKITVTNIWIYMNFVMAVVKGYIWWRWRSLLFLGSRVSLGCMSEFFQNSICWVNK